MLSTRFQLSSRSPQHLAASARLLTPLACSGKLLVFDRFFRCFLRVALILALTRMETDIYRSTFLCFLELVVIGGLDLFVIAVQEVRCPRTCEVWLSDVTVTHPNPPQLVAPSYCKQMRYSHCQHYFSPLLIFTLSTHLHPIAPALYFPSTSAARLPSLGLTHPW